MERAEENQIYPIHAGQAIEPVQEGSLQLVCGLATSLLKIDFVCIALNGADTKEAACDGVRFGQPLSRIVSFTLFAALGNEPMIVHDALEDQRLSRNPFVRDSGLRFFASIPLMSQSYGRLGTMCLIDRLPRALTSGELARFHNLASTALKHLERDAELRQCTEGPISTPGPWESAGTIDTRLRQTEKAASSGHCIVDVENGGCLFSEGMFRILGLRSAETLHNLASVEKWFRPEQWLLLTSALDVAARHGREFELPTHIVRPDGDIRNLVLKLRCEALRSCGTRKVFILCLDVTAGCVWL